jgi:SAM-dependent methyltransferase
MVNLPLSRIPEIFVGALDYRRDCDAMDIGQATFNEERLYRALEHFAVAWHREHGRPAIVLDLCCATGLTAERIASAVPVKSIALVDIDPDMLSRAGIRCAPRSPIESYCVDAVTFSSTSTFDIILMNSSYHHIEDSRKPAFLVNARSLLSHDGALLVGENFIFESTGSQGKQRSVVRFYSILLKALSDAGEKTQAINIIRRSGLYCWEGFYEYKVSWRYFLTQIQEAGLEVREYVAVWTATDDPRDFAGSCAVRLARR